jgi:hypothetical protein
VPVRPSPLWMAVAAAAAFSPGPARGQEGDTARDAARAYAAEGLKLYQSGQYASALEQLEKADAQYPAPQYRVYAARACAKRGLLSTAATWYTRAIRMELPPSAPASFRDAQTAAAAELAALRPRIPALRIVVTSASAEGVGVVVDGVPVPSADWSRVEVDPGRHRVAATAPGLAGGPTSVDVAEGALETVGLTLLPVGPAAPVERPSGGNGMLTAGFVVGGIGVAGLVVAGVTGGIWLSRSAAIDDACPLQGAVHVCSPHGRDLINGIGPLGAGNAAAWAIGITGVAGGVALTIVGRRAQASVSPSAFPGGGGLQLAGRF